VPLLQTLLSQGRRLLTPHKPMNNLPTKISTKNITPISSHTVYLSRSLRVSPYSLIRLVFLMKEHSVPREVRIKTLRRKLSVD